MLHFELAGCKLSLPVSWNEVTVSQFIHIHNQKNADLIDLLSFFSGIDYAILFASIIKLSQTDLDRISLALVWLEEELPDFNNMPCPDKFKIEDIEVAVPKDLRILSDGQMILLKEEVKRSVEQTGDTINAIVEAIAIYLYPPWSGKKFNADELDDLKIAIAQTKIVDAYPVAAFFLRSCTRLLKTKTIL